MGTGPSPEAITAFHEAGHAVTAIVLGIQLNDEGITVNPKEKDLRGKTTFNVPNGFAFFAMPHHKMRRLATVLCAGPLVEQWVTQRGAEGEGRDISLLLIILRLLTGCSMEDVDENPRCQKLLGHHIQKAADILNKEHRAVRALALELLKRKTLTGTEATEIIQSALTVIAV
jgi:ATP-dependent Zn protease